MFKTGKIFVAVGTGLLLVIFIGLNVIAAGFPVTIVDDLGYKVTVDKKPERIISLAPSNTEMLFALGLGRKIVGVTSYADYPEAALNKEKIGTILEPNIEKIITLKPDLVFAAGINKMETIKKLKGLGIKVVGFYPRNVNDTLLTIKEVGKITGKDKEARNIVTKLYLQLAEIQDLVDGILENNHRPKVFYEIWSNPLYTAGADSFIDDIINLAGGINIGAEAKGTWPQYSVEKLLLDNPDVYISSPHSAPHKVSVEKIKNRPNYQQIKAISNNRIYIIDQNIVNRPSPRVIEGLKLFVKAIFPELTDKLKEIN